MIFKQDKYFLSILNKRIHILQIFFSRIFHAQYYTVNKSTELIIYLLVNKFLTFSFSRLHTESTILNGEKREKCVPLTLYHMALMCLAFAHCEHVVFTRIILTNQWRLYTTKWINLHVFFLRIAWYWTQLFSHEKKTKSINFCLLFFWT